MEFAGIERHERSRQDPASTEMRWTALDLEPATSTV
jgi:hypothetical protein